MNDFKIYILFVIGLIIFSVWLLPQLRNTIDDVDSDPEPEWCLVTELPLSGGSFNHPGPSDGEDYYVLMTESGFKVFQRCGKIE